MHGTYLRGWRFDWGTAQKDSDRFFAAGREMMAAACADPGVVSCSQCGQTHWREFEVFECCRCGAEVTLDLDGKGGTHSGLPKFPEKCPPRLFDGMRVRWTPKNKTRRGRPNPGGWIAGKVPLGSCGTVRIESVDPTFTLPYVEFDLLAPEGDHRFGLLGDFLDDDFERLTDATERTATMADVAAHFERGVRGTADGIDVWPSWVYEARDAIKHRDQNVPWLNDLLKALDWKAGTIYEALQAVRRLVEAEKQREKAT